jgi:NAD(P)-dependent dehydrogenase (short-subunit alcohol dehydrogenase family)
MNGKMNILLTCSQGDNGRVIANKLAEEGHTVLTTLRDILGLTNPVYKEWAEAIDINNLPIHFFEMDVLDEDSVRESVKKIKKSPWNMARYWLNLTN